MCFGPFLIFTRSPAMLRSALIGLVAGQRAITPLALLAGKAQRSGLPDDLPGGKLLEHPLIATGAVALAAAEMAGDKMTSAPDRTVPSGLLARTLNSAYAGAALAPTGSRRAGAVVAVATAIGSSYLGLALRKRAMARFGQTVSGFVEDAIVLGAGALIAYRPTQGFRSVLGEARAAA